MTSAGRLGFDLVLLLTMALAMVPVQRAEAAPRPLRVLVAGFEEFGGLGANPTQTLAENLTSLPETIRAKCELRGVVLPVTYDGAWPRLRKESEDFHPQIALVFGLANSSPGIRLESVARNHDQGSPDNDGKRNKGSIVPGAPDSLKSGLPLDELRKALTSAGFSVLNSDNAGGYICNNVFYQLMRHMEKHPEMRGGFIHVPAMELAGSSGRPGLLRALEVILETLVEHATLFAAYEFEPLEDNVTGNLRRMEEIVSTMCKDRGVDFHLFPEMALTGFVHDSLSSMLDMNPELESDLVQRRLCALTASTGCSIGLGLPVREKGIWYNGFQVFEPGASAPVYTYLKNFLYGSDHRWATPAGGRYPTFELPCGRIGVVICHDLVYPQPYAAYAGQGVVVLLVATNWIGDGDGPYRYLRKYFAPITVISDRKGRESNIDFPGTTGLMLPGTPVEEHPRPHELAPGVRGVLYLAM